MLLSTCNMHPDYFLIYRHSRSNSTDSSSEEETEDKVVKKKLKTPKLSKYVH